MSFSTETYRNVFVSPWAQRGIVFVGKRYIPRRSAPRGVTLLCVHCAGSRKSPIGLRVSLLTVSCVDKEAWEPTIEYLYNTVKDTATGGPFIREAWSFDMQNHGEAAALNEAVLKEGITGLSK